MATWGDVMDSEKGTVWKIRGNSTVRIIRQDLGYDTPDKALHWNGEVLSIVGPVWASFLTFERTDETVSLVPTFKNPEPRKFTKHELQPGKVYRNFAETKFSRVGDQMYLKTKGSSDVQSMPVVHFVSDPEFTLVPGETFELQTTGVFE